MQKNRLRWVWGFLLVLIIVPLISYLVPSTSDFGTFQATGDVAMVGSEPVSAREFQAAYSGYLQRMSGQLTPEIIQAFRFHRQVLDGLIAQRVIDNEAKRMGLDVSPAEIERSILENPAFRVDNKFIGREQYKKMLENQVEEFENGIRLTLLQDKVRNVVTAAIAVSEKDAEQEYRRRNEKVKIDYFVVDPVKLEPQMTASEAELIAHYEKNKSRYTVPEKRKAKYLFISAAKYMGLVAATDEDLKAYLELHPDEFRAPETAVAQHILFKTAGKTSDEVESIRDKARGVLERAKKGEDFGKLAKEFSEDAGTASAGGNLGGFKRGQMAPEFDKAAFDLKIGEISDLVNMDDGFHIIKLNDKQVPRTPGFDEVKDRVRSKVLIERGMERASQLAAEAANEASATKSLEKAAQKTGAGIGEIKETDFVEQGKPLVELAGSQEFLNELFRLDKEGAFGPVVETPVGFAIPMLVAKQESHPASFEEAREKLVPDVKSEKAKELAVKKGDQVKELLKAGKDLASVAKAVGAEVKASDPIARGGGLPEFGSLTDQDKELFSLPIGKIGTPITLGSRTLAFAVKERKDIDPAEMRKNLALVRSDLLTKKRGNYFEAYIVDARKRMEAANEITINETLLEAIAKATT
jgi:peptidyl-prolyl cis-trans isomerase D